MAFHDPDPRPPEWITLSQAAERLGVHPATLRRWADDGQVPALLTPGGHRRFKAADLQRFAEMHAHLQTDVDAEEAWVGQAMTHVRREVERGDAAKRWANYTPAERSEYKKLGQRLMSVAMHYIADSAASDELLEEAKSIGTAQAKLALGHGHTITEALAAALFFRDALMEVAFRLPGSTRINPEPHARLLRRINSLLNVVQLAIGDVYDRAARVAE